MTKEEAQKQIELKNTINENRANISNAKKDAKTEKAKIKNVTLTEEEKEKARSSVILEGLNEKQAEKALKKAEDEALKNKKKELIKGVDEAYKKTKQEYQNNIEDATNELGKHYDSQLREAVTDMTTNPNLIKGATTAMSENLGGEKTDKELTANKTSSNEHLKELKDDSNALLKAISDMTTSETEKGIKETKDLIDKLTKGDLSYSVKDMPKGIIRAFKNGDFGKVKIDADIKADYLAEMKKPKEERDQAKIDAYKEELESVKNTHSTLGYFIVDAIGKGLSNIGTALQGGTGDKQSKWQEVQDSKLKGSLERYNKQWQELSDEMTERFKAKGIVDRQTLKDVAEIYKNQSLRPIIDKLDVDSMERTLIIAKNMGGKINFETLKNALMLQILQDPQGAISKAMGAGGDIVKMAIPK